MIGRLDGHATQTRLPTLVGCAQRFLSQAHRLAHKSGLTRASNHQVLQFGTTIRHNHRTESLPAVNQMPTFCYLTAIWTWPQYSSLFSRLSRTQLLEERLHVDCWCAPAKRYSPTFSRKLLVASKVGRDHDYSHVK